MEEQKPQYTKEQIDAALAKKEKQSNSKYTREQIDAALLMKEVSGSYGEEVNKVDRLIKGRESAFSNIDKVIKDAVNPSKRMSGSIGSAIQAAELQPAVQSAKIGMKVADVYGQLSESPVANVAIEAMRSPKETMIDFGTAGMMGNKLTRAFGRGVTGEERGEYGDVLRMAGVPEPLAAAGGIIAATLLDPFGIKQKAAQYASESVESAGRKIGRHYAKKQAGRKVEIGGETVRATKRSLNEITSDLKESIQKKYREISRKSSELSNEKISKIREEADKGISKLDIGDDATKLAKQKILKQEVDTATKLEVDKIILNRALGKEKVKNLDYVKNTLKGFYKKNSRIYKERIDRLSKGIMESGEGLSGDDMVGIIEDTLSKSESEFLVDDTTYKRLKKLHEKYKGRTDATFKEIFTDYKNIRDLAKDDDVTAMFFNRKWIDTAKKISPEFKLLQQQYAPIMETKEYTRKAFKLFGNKYESRKKVENFLDLAANGSLSETEKGLLRDLAKSNPGFSEGIKNLLGNTEIIGNEIKKREAMFSKIDSTFKKQIAELDAAIKARSSEQIKSLRGEAAKKIKQERVSYSLQKLKLENQREIALKKVTERAREGKMLLKNSKQWSKNKNWVKGIAGSVLVYELITRPVRRTLYNFEKD